MARNGSGTYNRIAGVPYVYNTVIDQVVVNSEFDDIAAALTASIAKDGQTTPTANLPMGGFLHTNVAAATARTHYARASQVQDSALTWCGTAGGTADAFTLSPAIAITAYATGQAFQFLAVGTNTGAATVNVSGVGAKAVQVSGSALVGGEIVSGKLYSIRYDGTQFQLEHVSVSQYIATLLNDANAAAARGTLGLVIGTDVQPYDADIPTVSASQAEMEAGTEAALRSMSPLRVAQAIAALSTTTFSSAAENIAGTVENKAVDPLGIREAFNAAGSAGVYACRAWANFNGTLTGTIAPRAGGNVANITKNGTGDYTVNFSVALVDGNYSVSFGNGDNTANVTQAARLYSSATTTAGGFRFLLSNNSAGLYDASVVTFSVFR